jgi:probable FeS assembly SUF system protein SufT
MKGDEQVILTRDCEGIVIPTGEKITLPAGSTLGIIKSLGDSCTVTTDRGYMVRIGGQDADALGMGAALPSQSELPTAESPADVEKLVWDQLKKCFDPEIPVNIVDLGLVYRCRVISLAEGGNRVEVRFTLTAPGCGMGDVLKADMQSKIESIPGIKQVAIELVWDPPWDQSMMSGTAKLELGMV